MKWLDNALVPMASVVITNDIRSRMKLPHVGELAGSFTEATGGQPGNALWVRRVGEAYEIVAGRDRCAALLLLKAEMVPVRIGEWTPVELIRAEAEENLRRRHDDKGALMAKMSRDLQAALAADERNKPLRPAAIKAAARKEIAKAAGTTPAAVKQAEHRAAVKTREAAGTVADKAAAGAEVTSPVAASPPPIETWRMPLPPTVRLVVESIQAEIDGADKHMRAAKGAMSSSRGAVFDMLRDEIQRAGAKVRAARPSHLCPFCKSDERVGAGFIAACVFCRGQGWVTEEQMNACPRELQCAGMYGLNGRFASFEKAQSEWTKERMVARGTAARPKANGKHIRVLVEGQEVKPDLEVVRDEEVGDDSVPF